MYLYIFIHKTVPKYLYISAMLSKNGHLNIKTQKTTQVNTSFILDAVETKIAKLVDENIQ